MTAYKNFIEDFPSRCMDILNKVQLFRNIDREVTLSLVVAAAGIVTPFERLKPTGQYEHPSGDREKYPEYADKLSRLLECNFLGSFLHPESETSWGSGKLKTIEGDPDEWEGLRANKTLPRNKTVSGVLKVIRNAVAHGNLYTKGNPIEQIIFVSVNSKPDGTDAKSEKREIVDYSFVSMPPEDFLLFLQKWFEFIKKQNLSQFDVKRLLDAA